MLKKSVLFVGLLLGLATCQGAVSKDSQVRILAIGDSLMAWNSVLGSSIPKVIAEELNEPVIDHSVSGARMLTRDYSPDKKGFAVPYQYEKGPWDWVVVTGGGNDLLFGCGCGRCDKVMDQMISKDGLSGQIPDLFRRIRADGARVLYSGYLRSPNLLTPIEHCKDDGDEMEARIARLAGQEEGIVFASMAHIVPPGGLTYFAPDLIHPARKTSRLIGERLSRIIRDFDAKDKERASSDPERPVILSE
ncbi:SGNH/GDSL hydrolase family protein [Phaeobacter sp. NW0010-22]|uniref:SGNH/GDSL hydrolase family protein n=1 Tax=Phaeobacter sp. NW0010-22 TaxID=3135907 RepID=UPI003106BD1F